MNRFLKRAVIAVALIGTPLTMAHAEIGSTGTEGHRSSELGLQVAAISFSFNFGTVAVGYSDGYWDNNHRWHRWRNNQEQSRYRAIQGANYYGMRHDRARNNGWDNRGRNGNGRGRANGR